MDIWSKTSTKTAIGILYISAWPTAAPCPSIATCSKDTVDGTFADVADKKLLVTHGKRQRGLTSVAFADFDSDGILDVFLDSPTTTYRTRARLSSRSGPEVAISARCKNPLTSYRTTKDLPQIPLLRT